MSRTSELLRRFGFPGLGSPGNGLNWSAGQFKVGSVIRRCGGHHDIILGFQVQGGVKRDTSVAREGIGGRANHAAIDDALGVICEDFEGELVANIVGNTNKIAWKLFGGRKG